MTREDYTRFVNLFIDDVKRVAFASCRNDSDADDITQNVFVKLLKYRGEFQDDEHVKRWLIRVTVNECNSFFRSPWKKRVDYFVPEDIPMESTDFYGDSHVMEVLNSINRRYREMVILYYYEEYSVSEIAEILGISEAAVLKRLQRTRETVKKCLMKEEEAVYE